MAYFDPKNPTLVYWYRKGTQDDPFVPYNEPIQIDKGKAKLSEIPDEFNRVKVTDEKGNILSEIKQGIPSPTEYLIDYSVGVAYVNGQTWNGKALLFEYMGRGGKSISADLIWTQLDTENMSILETLQDIITQGREGIDALKDVYNFKYIGVYDNEFQYQRNNMVFYNMKFYIATDYVIGENPDTSDKWVLASNGFSWKGVYKTATAYHTGDWVQDSNGHNLYLSLTDNNTRPLTDTSHWIKVMSITDLVNNVNTAISNANTATNNANQAADRANTFVNNHVHGNEPHRYGNRFAWRYNSSNGGVLELVVYD